MSDFDIKFSMSKFSSFIDRNAAIEKEWESLTAKVKELEATCKDHGEIQSSLCRQLSSEQSKVMVLTDALRYSIKQVPELAIVPGIEAALLLYPEIMK